MLARLALAVPAVAVVLALGPAHGSRLAACSTATAAVVTATDADEWNQLGDTCKTDTSQVIIDNSLSDNKRELTFEAKNDGVCNVALTILNEDLTRKETTVFPKNHNDVHITLPPGSDLVAKCSSDADYTCKWHLKKVKDTEVAAVKIQAPKDAAVYPRGKPVKALFKCPDALSCSGTVPNNGLVDTDTLGTHQFTVTAPQPGGHVSHRTVVYRVVYSFNGFFRPVSNTAAGTLNLAHAGDLLKTSFGLNGNQGPDVLAGPPQPQQIPCPPWQAHLVPPAGPGSVPGLTYSVASRHYFFVWQTSPAWAGSCVRFTLTLNDGTAPHTADFQFFA